MIIKFGELGQTDLVIDAVYEGVKKSPKHDVLSVYFQ